MCKSLKIVRQKCEGKKSWVTKYAKILKIMIV